MLLFAVIINQRRRRDYRKLRERVAKQKFVSRITRAFQRRNLAFQVKEVPNGDILILLPRHFQRHEIRQIHILVERIYNKLWEEYGHSWSYAILHGSQVKTLLHENRKPKKRSRRPYRFSSSHFP